jgi:HAD superfamily 5'-nucleotidase-like hydrolase
MRHIKYIGLDMDHTLVRYNTEKFESLVYALTIDYLINVCDYPDIIRELEFDFSLAIRGLIIDKANGNLLKISLHGGIRQSRHGLKSIHYAEQKKIYRTTYIDLFDDNYKSVDTGFSLSACTLLSQLVDLRDKGKLDDRTYEQIANDTLVAVDKVHILGELKKQVTEHLEDYVYRDESLVMGLKRHIQHGKKIFIITNSDYAYTKPLLDYAINPYLAKGENWSDLFEFVITLADKPRFFYDNLNFLKIDPQTDTMTNLKGPLLPGIYQGGCATKFTTDLGLTGDQILYVGDHIYGDVLRLKKDCNWRTALVVEELGAEIEGQKKAKPHEDEIATLMVAKTALEKKYVDLSSKEIEEKTKKYNDLITNCLNEMAAIDIEIANALKAQRNCFNPHWGRVFRSGAEESYFAHQTNRFACIYMEKIHDLFNSSPRSYFRPSRRLLTHERQHAD